MKPRVDYDALAPTYNRRFKAEQRRGTQEALLELAEARKPDALLEVGCGTGRWLEALSARIPACYGLDPSAGMLAQARARQAPLHLVRGRGEALPFPAASFDLVYCVNAIHHMDDPRAFVTEARRLLRPGGTFAVIGWVPHGRRDSWYVYRYFPGTYETDVARFPAWESVGAWMAEAGFTSIERRPVEHIHEIKRGRAVLDDPFLEKHACSQLALLSDAAYAEGVQRIRADLERDAAAGTARDFPSDILLEMLSGRTGSSAP